MSYCSNWGVAGSGALVAVLALGGCGHPTTPTSVESPAASSGSPTVPPAPLPTPTAGSPLVVTVITAPFRAGVMGLIAYRVESAEVLTTLTISISGGGPGTAVVRTETSPASTSGTFSLTVVTPATYQVRVTATTRDGRVLEQIVTLNVEP